MSEAAETLKEGEVQQRRCFTAPAGEALVVVGGTRWLSQQGGGQSGGARGHSERGILHKSFSFDFFFVNYLFLFLSPGPSAWRLSGGPASPPPPPGLCVCVVILWVSASLRRRLSHHLDAVLLQLRSEQSVLVLQLFNLKNKDGEKKSHYQRLHLRDSQI